MACGLVVESSGRPFSLKLAHRGYTTRSLKMSSVSFVFSVTKLLQASRVWPCYFGKIAQGELPTAQAELFWRRAC